MDKTISDKKNKTIIDWIASLTIEQKLKLAEDHNTSSDVLAALAEDSEVKKDGNEIIRIAIATNPNTLPETLAELAKDKAWLVRTAVAENHNTPPEVLEELSNDDYWLVRLAVADNPNTPLKVLKKLANDEKRVVRDAAIKWIESQGLLRH